MCIRDSDKRLQRLQKNLCKRVYYFVNVYLNKNHMSKTKQNYDGKPSYSALRSITDRVHWVTVLVTVNSCLMMEHLLQRLSQNVYYNFFTFITFMR